MKITLVAGARPNFIKIAPIIRSINKYNASSKGNFIEAALVHTGQHYDYNMSQIFFQELMLPTPDVYLGVGSGTHAEQTGRVMIEFEKILFQAKPDLVVVVGDVNSTLAAALTAAKLDIPVAHVEAGLRSYDRTMPEEINRVLTDHCSQLLFCPTKTATDNLRKEGITKGVCFTGDVMVDVLFANRKIAEKSDILERLGLESKQYLVATIHRQSNTDDLGNLKNIVEALYESPEKVIFPVHPRTRKALHEHGVNIQGKNMILIEPLGYIDFLKLMSHAKKILTDSGGVQKEAYILGVPCITLRTNTEWLETVEDNWNIVVGADKQKIIEGIRHYEASGPQRKIFGNGRAAIKICRILSQWKTGKTDT